METTINKTRRTRTFSLVTYLTEEQIKRVLNAHGSSIRAYAYILHNEDKKQDHYHLIFKTFDAWSIAQIEKWFKNYYDEEQKEINTFVERATDLHALYQYFTHTDPDSIAQGKHVYSKDEIKDSGNLFELIETKTSVDETLEIVDHIVNGAPTRWLIRRYGKMYIFHYQQFQAVADAVKIEDRYDENERQRTRAQYKKFETNAEQIKVEG